MSRAILIVGRGSFTAGVLPKMLRASGFEAAVIAPEEFAGGDTLSRNPDVLVVESSAMKGADEEFFSLLVNARGFLLSLENTPEPEASGEFQLYPGLSAEEIVSRINGVIFRFSNIRKNRRITVRLEAEYRCADRCARTTMQNLSTSGAFLSTLNPLEQGSQFSLTFDLGDGAPVTARCCVLYSVGYDLERSIISHPAAREKSITAVPGMGVYFEDMSEDDRRRVELFIEENA